MTEDDDGGEVVRVVLVPDGDLATALADIEGLGVETVTGGPAAVRERVAAAGADAVVHRHDGGESDSIAAAAREAAAGLPVVRVVPDGARAAPADPDKRTAHVREVGDWPAAVADRVAALATETPYRELYHTADAGLLLHPGETAEAVATSDSLHEMLGYEPGGDLDLDQIIAGEQEDFSREEAEVMVQETLAEGERTFEWLDERKDGSKLWVDVTLRPVEIRGEGQVVATIHDVDARKATEQEAASAEEAAAAAESRREATLERVSEAFFGLDREWRFTYLNEQAGDLIDVDPDAVGGESVWEVFPRAVGTQFEYEYRAAMHTQEPTTFESYYRPLETWFEVTAYPSTDGLSVYFQDVTERKRREAELEAYERLVENVEEELFVLDEDGRFKLVTEPLAAWLGRAREGIEGEPAAPLLAPVEADAGGTAVTDGAAAAIERAVEEGVSTSFETEVVTGTTRQAGIVELSPLPGGAVGSVRDVTAERARQRSHDALVDNVPGMVYRRALDPAAATDGSGAVAEADEGMAPRMTFASEAAADVAGEAPTDFIEGEAHWLHDVVHPEDRERLLDRLRTAVTDDEPFTVRYRIVTPEGTKWVRERGRPVVGPDGRVTSVEGFVVDVTAETQRDRHRRVMMRVLRHNLRNSVQVVSGFAEEIVSRAATANEPELASMAETIDSRAESLAELSETARDLDDIVGAALGGDGSVDAAALCRTVVTDHRERHPDADITVDLPERLSVRADATLEEAIDALVENAIVHNDGDPAVRLSTFAPEREGWVGISVADDGPGIPKRERAVLTEEAELTQLVHGRGLGLWLVKWLVESYGGELDIDATVNDPDGTEPTGSTVSILLPLGE